MSWDQLWARADVEIAAGDLEGARETYHVLSHRAPSGPLEYLRAGLAAYRLNDDSRALDTLEAGHVKYRADSALAESYLRGGLEQGQLERLVANLDATAARDACSLLVSQPMDRDAQLNLVAYCFRIGFDELAEAKVAEIAQTSDDVIPLWMLSDDLLARGRKDHAAAIYRHLSVRVPDRPVTAVYVGLALERLGDLARAAELLDTEFSKYPTATFLREQLLRISLNIGDMGRVMRLELPDATDHRQACEVLFSRLTSVAQQLKLIEHCLEQGYLDLVTAKALTNQSSLFDNSGLWNVADILEGKGFASEARQIRIGIIDRPRTTAADAYFAAAAALRLGQQERCMSVTEDGLRGHPHDHSLRHFYLQLCAGRIEYDRYMRTVTELNIDAELGIHSIVDFFKAAVRAQVTEAIVINYKDIERLCTPAEFATIRDFALEGLKNAPPSAAAGRLLLFFSRYLDLDDDFVVALWTVLNGTAEAAADEVAIEREQRALEMLLRLTPPMVPSANGQYREQIDRFVEACLSLASTQVTLTSPIADMSSNWTPWQYLFCTGAMDQYGAAISALERLAFATWPDLNQTANHLLEPKSTERRRIRIGFIVHDSMPMMSGLLDGLHKSVFETVFLRPGGKGQSRAAQNWITRAERTVEFSDHDPFAAITTIAAEQLDIIVSGPSVAAIFFPLMARLAHLQMVLLEPNWTDGFTNADYYISWRPAEPEQPDEYYRTKTALLEHPPYFIERHGVGALSDQAKAGVRQRLLGAGPSDRIYLCANTPPKIHPDMDNMFLKLLERDHNATLVILRGDYPPSKTLRTRLQRKLGRMSDRVVYLPTLNQADAHSLLQSVDCCLDSFPLCGMSSSFDAAMMGVPLVTLPTDAPFGKWTATMYDYIGVSGLTAQTQDEYLELALKLAHDRGWREEMGAEIQAKAARFVESQASVAEFADFIGAAWARHRQGLPPTHWLDTKWRIDSRRVA